jgi:hypothetical protein
MSIRLCTIPFTLLLSASLLVSCASNESSEPNVVVKQTVEDLPNCSNGKFGAVYYVVSEDTFYFCDGGEFIAVDLSGQDGTSCTVTDDGAGTVTIACEDGTVATVSDGQDGTDGQDGQDGTSCTVTRDDAAGTTTVSCEDGTVAVVEDGQDGQNGQDGQDGTSCTIADTAAGAIIACGAETVTITDGQDGSSCSASTDAAGAVTIACDDGTSATIPAGGEDGSDAVFLLCDLLDDNPDLIAPFGIVCPCPCFTAEEVASESTSGCRERTAISGLLGEVEFVVESLPDDFPPLPGSEFPTSGAFVVGNSGNFRYCNSPTLSPVSRLELREFEGCRAIIEDELGPCEVESICADNSACDDGNDCTANLCASDGQCQSSRLPDGTECADGAGQCIFGACALLPPG